MDEYMTEHEQWEAAKQWLKAYGVWIVVGVTLGVLGITGWRWWQSHQESQALQASAKFEQILEAFDRGNRTQALMLMGELEREHPSSPYVDQANLVAARVAVESGELDRAARLLGTVMNNTRDRELALVARVRLARVQLAQGKPDEALTTLNAVEPGAFAPRFHEVRGDVYYAKGDKVAALKEYQAARASDVSGMVDVGQLDLKINDLLTDGVSAESSTASAAN